jgi:hypothetical protein
LKRECHSKTAVLLKECSPKASQSIFKDFGSGFTELQAKIMQARCSIFPSIADKTKQEVEKALV